VRLVTGWSDRGHIRNWQRVRQRCAPLDARQISFQDALYLFALSPWSLGYCQQARTGGAERSIAKGPPTEHEEAAYIEQ
jgi:hypothetical protein